MKIPNSMENTQTKCEARELLPIQCVKKKGREREGRTGDAFTTTIEHIDKLHCLITPLVSIETVFQIKFNLDETCIICNGILSHTWYAIDANGRTKCI